MGMRRIAGATATTTISSLRTKLHVALRGRLSCVLAAMSCQHRAASDDIEAMAAGRGRFSPPWLAVVQGATKMPPADRDQMDLISRGEFRRTGDAAATPAAMPGRWRARRSRCRERMRWPESWQGERGFSAAAISLPGSAGDQTSSGWTVADSLFRSGRKRSFISSTEMRSTWPPIFAAATMPPS